MRILHEGFHVLFVMAFISAAALMVLALMSPVVFPEGPRPKVARLGVAAAVGAVAVLGLAADWLMHGLR